MVYETPNGDRSQEKTKPHLSIEKWGLIFSP